MTSPTIWGCVFLCCSLWWLFCDCWKCTFLHSFQLVL